MTKVAIIATNDRVYGVNKSFELLSINPVDGKNVVFKPNFNTGDPVPASSHMDTVKQMIIKIKEMGRITTALYYLRMFPVFLRHSWGTQYQLSGKRYFVRYSPFQIDSSIQYLFLLLFCR